MALSYKTIYLHGEEGDFQKVQRNYNKTVE